MANRVQLLGRVASDPELKYTPAGIAVISFRIAVDRPYQSVSGERETDFLTVKAWRDLAERLANELTKGRLTFVDGRIEARSWDGPDGTKRYATEIVANNVVFQDVLQMEMAVIASSSQTINECYRFLNRVSSGDSSASPRQNATGYDDRSTPPAYASRQPAAAPERPQAAEPTAADDDPDYGDPFSDQ